MFKFIFPIFAFAALSLSSCKPEEKIVYVEVIREVEVIKEIEIAGETTVIDNTVAPTTDTAAVIAPASTELLLTGSLAVDSSTTAIGLTSFGLAADESTHSIYCTTFEDNPIACAAEVIGGEFSKACDDYAGKTFGCFLRKGTVTLTTIEFGGDTSLVTGAGTLKSAIVYDSNTGLARAKIDEEASSALSPEAIATAMEVQGVVTTVLPVMTDTWNISCVNDPDSGMYCDPEEDPNFTTAVDTSKDYCLVAGDGAAGATGTGDTYIKCDSGGVDVPEGFCYTEWASYDSVTMMDIPGYYDCSMDYAYCSDPAMSMMPECLESGAKERDPVPEQIYLSEYEDPVTGVLKVGLWENKARHDACVGDNGTEKAPEFGIKLGNGGSSFTLYEFNLSNKVAMDASIDQALNDMIGGGVEHKFIAEKIIAMGATREAWKVEQCNNSPYDYPGNGLADTLESDTVNGGFIQSERCKFRLEEFDSYTWEDWSTGSPITRTETYPKWWWDIYDFNHNENASWSTTASSLGVTQETVQCTFDAADGSGKPFCPNYASAAGSFDQFYKIDANGNRARLMLVCRVEQNSWDWLQQSVSPSSDMSTAITALKTASGCGAVYTDQSNVLADLPGVQLESIRRVAIELSLSKNYKFDASQLCHGVEPETGWTFNSCDSMAYGSAGYQLCWENWNFNSKLGMQKDSSTGTYYSGCSDSSKTDQGSCDDSSYTSIWYANGSECSDMMYYDEYSCEAANFVWQPSFACSDGSSADEATCNTTQTYNTWVATGGQTYISEWDSYFYEVCASFDATTQTKLELWDAAGRPESDSPGTTTDLINSCRDYLNLGTSTERLTKQKNIAKQMAMKWEWMPTKAIACAAPTPSIKSSFMDGIEQGCMADASLNMFCDNSGNCMSSLRCNGSGEGGKCYKDGAFIGNIPGRMGFMDLKLRSDGAFELSETKDDRWSQWNVSDNKEETCTATRSMILTSKKSGNDEFSSVLKTTEKLECVSKSTGTCSDTTYTTKTECDDNSGTWTETQSTGAAGGTTAAGGANGNAAAATNFDRAGMGDLLQKLKFDRCADATCSEYD